MVTEFKFPDVGEGITEGRIKTWLVKVGDRIEEDDNMAQVETDKAIVDMPSPAEGTVLEIKVDEGEKVQVGEVMIVIGEEGEEAPVSTPEEKEEKPPEEEKAKEPQKEEAPKGKVFALPKVRKLAKDLGVDISSVSGTGPKGRITEEDVKKASEAKEEKPKKKAKKFVMKMNYDFYGHISYKPYTGLREVIGKRMETSKFTIPHAAAMEDVDVSDLWDLRKGMNEEMKEKGERLTFMPFIIKAVQKSLLKHPSLNAMLDEENEEIVIKEYYNIGVATDTKDGLIVPVVKRVETKGLSEIQKDMDNLIDLSRDRTIDLADLRGGTFTISNYGAIGGIYGVPVINFPEAAILGVGRIREEPRVLDGEIVPRRIMGIVVAFDHRIIDGAEVARFMNTLKDYLEHPGKILV